MNGTDLVEKLAEMQRQYADAHRPARSIEQYRERHARRHPDGITTPNGTFHSKAVKGEGHLPACIFLKSARAAVASVILHKADQSGAPHEVSF